MRAFVLLALALFTASALESEVDLKEKPIQKIVRLLKEMQGQLEKEAEEDEDMFDKMGCWCDTNDKEKTKAIAINTQMVTDLGSSIEELTAKSAQLKTDIEETGKQLAAAEASLEEASTIREKESGEFFAGEKDSIQNIESVKGAVMALGKTQNAALSQESLMQVRAILRKHMDHHKNMFASKQRRFVMSLLQQPDGADTAAFLQAQAPQSGAIFGILKQMKESFETNLDTARTDEKSAVEEYTSMKGSKEDEIAAATELIDSKKAELAQTDENNAAAKKNKANTEATLEADTEFLANLKEKCANAESEYNARSKVRNEEIQAVGEALGIITDDDAKDLLLKFVQVSAHNHLVSSSGRRQQALRFMEKAAANRPRLAAITMSMKLDAFTKVKENIDNMVVALKQEQKDEVVKKDFCIKELHQNDMQTTEATNKKDDLTQAIADFETSKTTLADEIKALDAEIKETMGEIKRASELRVSQNKVFQETVTDQTATQAIIKKALNRLKDFYGFAQTKSFLQYKKHGGSSSVMAMMEEVINDSKEEQAQAIKDENDASAAYQQYIADSKAALETMNKDKVAKTEELANADSSKAEAEGDLQQTEADLLGLMKYKMQLHTDCDFLTKFFDIRQQKRAEEIEALQQAKAIFSGAF